MIISHRHRFIFVKTRKTAGTSLEIALSALCGPDDIITPISDADERTRRELGYPGPQNVRLAEEQRSEAGASTTSTLRRRGSFVNHASAAEIAEVVGPDIWKSYFTFSIERNPFDKALSRYWWGTRALDPRPPVTEFLRRIDHALLTNWDTYTIDDSIAVDFLMRYETLADDIAELGDRIGTQVVMPATRAKGGHRTDRRHYAEVLDPDARRHIETVCAREIEALSYRWEQPRGDRP